MSETMHTVSVIICAYTEERWDDLVAAVESVRQQTLQATEIIVVVDHNPQLLKRVQNHMLNATVVENTEARGLSDARNSGIAAAKSSIVVFLDDDAIAASDWLLFLNEAFSDPQILGVGGSVIPLWLDGIPIWLPEEFYWVVGCTYKGVPQTAQVIRNPIGANMSFRREVFDTVGGFRCGIGRVGIRPLGCEETELCIRATQYWPQRNFLYQPQASVFHRVPRNRTRWHYFFSRCYSEGISKASVSNYVGIKQSLASERTYTFRTLPRGVIRGLVDALFHHDLGGFVRAGAIIAGLTVTTAGYIAGNVFLHVSKSRKDFDPEVVFRHGTEASQSLKTRTGV